MGMFMVEPWKIICQICVISTGVSILFKDGIPCFALANPGLGSFCRGSESAVGLIKDIRSGSSMAEYHVI